MTVRMIVLFSMLCAAPMAAEAAERRAWPEPSLAHLRTLSDDTGIFEHATYDIPNRKHAYCTEDVARALVAALMFRRRFRAEDPVAADLAGTYMSYLHYSQKENGDFYHRVNIEGERHGRATEDSYGRALWGLGYAAAHPASPGMGLLAKKMFDKSLWHAENLKWPRAMAYAMLGLYHYLERYPDAEEPKVRMRALADSLLGLYEANSSEEWPWFEKTMTYDNAKLPLALLWAYERTGETRYRDAAKESLDFLIERGFRYGGMLNVVGNRGWYGKGGEPALYDQQPLDAAAMVEACAAAHRLLGEEKYREKMRRSFEWFLGKNIAEAPVYDPVTGGSRDGIAEKGVNQNQGAESSIELLIALLTLREAEGL